VRGIIGELKVTGGVTIIDMEAGLELFGRGTPGPSDVVITVVEPSLWSIQTSMRVSELAKELGIPKVLGVANKVRDESDVRWMREALQPYGVDIVAEVPYDPAVTDADRKMRSLIDVAPESPAARAIGSLVDVIEALPGMGKPSGSKAQAGNGHVKDPHEGHDHAPGDEAGCPWVVDRY
jgi:CO dehydrogenase nickel-insertion accessory protein CooC1